jgi:hypothetical protein
VPPRGPALRKGGARFLEADGFADKQARKIDVRKKGGVKSPRCPYSRDGNENLKQQLS